MLRTIVTHPDPILRQEAAPVAVVDAEVQQLIQDMFETMYAAPGVGLAAPQVGVSRQVIVIDLMPDGVTTDEDRAHLAELKEGGYPGPVALVNPMVSTCTGELCWEEGCLSLPTITVEMSRCEAVVVTALDRQGQPIELHAEGFFAVALQHEIDHLRGRLLIDALPKLKQASLTRKLRELKKKALRDEVET